LPPPTVTVVVAAAAAAAAVDDDVEVDDEEAVVVAAISAVLELTNATGFDRRVSARGTTSRCAGRASRGSSPYTDNVVTTIHPTHSSLI
jgi:hypothetical protein